MRLDSDSQVSTGDLNTNTSQQVFLKSPKRFTVTETRSKSSDKVNSAGSSTLKTVRGQRSSD